MNCVRFAGKSWTPQTCMVLANTTSLQVGLCGSSGLDSIYPITVPGPVTYRNFENYSIQVQSVSSVFLFAPLVQINWKSSDISVTTTQQSQLPSPTSLITLTSSTSINTIETSSMSAGDKIALGVALPLGVISIAGMATFLWLRKRRQKGQQTVTSGTSHVEKLDAPLGIEISRGGVDAIHPQELYAEASQRPSPSVELVS